jgi:predicted nucleotidyltransferase
LKKTVQKIRNQLAIQMLEIRSGQSGPLALAFLGRDGILSRWTANQTAGTIRLMAVRQHDPGLTGIDAIERALWRTLTAWPMVRAAWLFGSIATQSAGALSDVDVAVLGAGALSFDERARLAAELGRAAGRCCDVVMVEQASPVLSMAIVDTGRRFFCRDVDAADAWEDRALRHYLGTAELRRIVYRYVREDLSAGR